MSKMACVGKVEEFDSSSGDWESYIERVELYCDANDIEDEKKSSVLLSLMGAKTYSLLRNLLSPAKPSSKSYKDIVDTLQKHLNPAPLVIAERFRFHKRNQTKDESISEYMAELRKLSQHCDFKTGLDDALRDRLVCGMHCTSTQKRLLSEKELDLKKALELAISMETAAKGASELQKKSLENEVHQMSLYRKKQNCYRCGKSSHNANDCWFKDKTCRKCHKQGHIERACKSDQINTQKEKSGKNKGFKPKSKVKATEMHKVTEHSDNTNSSEDDDLSCLELHSITEEDRKIIWVTTTVSGVKLKMELDTGSALSVISETDYDRLFSHLPLKKTSVMLKTYTGEKVSPKGKLKVNVVYGDQTHKLELYVLKTTGPALLGREWLRRIQLDWNAIKALNISTDLKSSIHRPEQRLSQLLEANAHVFEKGIGKLKHIKAKIELDKDANPRFHKARPVPYALRPKIDAELQNLEASGILSKVDWSDWATPIVPVMKKGKSEVRICGDFKVSINPVLRTVQYPLPRIEDIFSSLAGGKKFSKIDLSQAYLQMEVEESSKKFLTINTHKGLYQYNRLVFGVASAPAIWQRAMDQVLQDIPGTQCYLDDIIITGKDDDDHFQNLSKVLTRLNEYGLRAKREKCEFFKSEISYCGHVIDKHGLHKSQEKIEAVLKAPKPENVSQLRSYLGLVNYYHKFLPNLASVLYPLNALLQTGVEWKWCEKCEKAFTETKRLITSDELLTHYDPSRPIRLACDASPYGIGAVLSHTMDNGLERPIAFASRSLSSAERNYAQIDREALSLVWGIKKFHHYLYGRRFTLVTDHQPLVSIFNPRKGVPVMSAARLQRWALFLGAHSYDIEFKGTKQHCNADGLSRLPLSTSVEEPASKGDPAEMFHTTLIDQLPVTNAMIRKETRNDPALSKVYDITVQGWPAHGNPCFPEFSARRDQLSVCQGTLMCGSRVVVPSKLRTRVLDSLHEAHVGTVKMKSLARSYVWWPGIDKQIEDITKTCPGCLSVQNAPPQAPLHPWEWPSAPWQRVHIDFAGPFMNSMFLIAVDAHSKWPEVVPMKSTTSEKTISVLRTIFARNGLPEQIVSDNGPQYTSEEFQDFMKKNGIKHFKSAPHHPATNGLAERFVQTFKKAMKAMTRDDISIQHKIDNFLLVYRNSVHTTTNQSPALLFMNRQLRSRIDLLKPNLRREVQNKQFSNFAREPPRSFDVGQQVLARDYRGEKWTPGKIITRSGPLMYEVDTGEHTWRRHVDQLLNAQPKTPEQPARPPGPETNSEPSTVTPPVAEDVPPTESTPQAPRRNPERLRAPPKRLDL
ncbi:PREDICTED: uncharacterized protein K02A2.6-like [Poecilia mexicana]|uniref:uncharacterized protein K02A2.6-like n=1 Tax=Poecilia mexicana TaxID=48701 RepID=UPI00072DD827|nr:PREDICTED: uncharacterized protein K02A2.6-like [Poecilia mexicana]